MTNPATPSPSRSATVFLSPLLTIALLLAGGMAILTGVPWAQIVGTLVILGTSVGRLAPLLPLHGSAAVTKPRESRSAATEAGAAPSPVEENVGPSEAGIGVSGGIVPPNQVVRDLRPARLPDPQEAEILAAHESNEPVTTKGMPEPWSGSPVLHVTVTLNKGGEISVEDLVMIGRGLEKVAGDLSPASADESPEAVTKADS